MRTISSLLLALFVLVGCAGPTFISGPDTSRLKMGDVTTKLIPNKVFLGRWFHPNGNVLVITEDNTVFIYADGDVAASGAFEYFYLGDIIIYWEGDGYDIMHIVEHDGNVYTFVGIDSSGKAYMIVVEKEVLEWRSDQT